MLLVEDHTDTRVVLAKLLTSQGCRVSAAGSVEEAIGLADKQPFDLMLSDIGLPDGSGLDLKRHVASKYKITGIALTGFGQDEDLRRSRDAGFTTHLTKPVTAQALEHMIKAFALK